MDSVDRAIINELQGGFPLSPQPYAEAARKMGLSEDVLIGRLEMLLAEGILTRFGPMFHAERMGGGLTLAALQVPEKDFDRIAEIVNGFPEVAHNYQRDHKLNMWFVVATERADRIAEVIAEIEEKTRLNVHNMPKIEEFYVGLRFEA
ncbi:MAG: AsnC family transcriptional regulator [Rhodospirillales bacterium]|nr:AsnC family transcriptional regulator [Rhodospirillales bacterium]